MNIITLEGLEWEPSIPRVKEWLTTRKDNNKLSES
jgi:hypothetical protein